MFEPIGKIVIPVLVYLTQIARAKPPLGKGLFARLVLAPIPRCNGIALEPDLTGLTGADIFKAFRINHPNLKAGQG